MEKKLEEIVDVYNWIYSKPQLGGWFTHRLQNLGDKIDDFHQRYNSTLAFFPSSLIEGNHLTICKNHTTHEDEFEYNCSCFFIFKKWFEINLQLERIIRDYLTIKHKN